MSQSNKFLRRGLGQSDWKSTLILAFLSSQILKLNLEVLYTSLVKLVKASNMKTSRLIWEDIKNNYSEKIF